MLGNRNAVIYGGGGSLGSAVGRALAAEGARVILAGRTLASVEKVAADIRSSGGKAEAARVDALAEDQVNDHLAQVLNDYGSVDISFNAIDLASVQGIPLVEMKMTDFLRPVTIAMQSMFLTAVSAARIMKQQRSGVILSLTATSASISYPYTGGFSPAGAAIELMSMNLAAELGAYGIRVVNIRSAGSPDSRVFREAIDAHPDKMKEVLTGMEDDSMLKRLPLMTDIARVATFLCSDAARQITGVTIDVTGGSTSGLNYRAARQGNWPREY